MSVMLKPSSARYPERKCDIMSAIREKLIDYINTIPEYKLTPLEPLP